jgi:hypothetical protein
MARVWVAAGRGWVLEAIEGATAMKGPQPSGQAGSLRHLQTDPETTLFENKYLGPWLALACMAAMFAVPVYAAYQFASWAQPIVDELAITPLKVDADGWVWGDHAGLVFVSLGVSGGALDQHEYGAGGGDGVEGSHHGGA